MSSASISFSAIPFLHPGRAVPTANSPHVFMAIPATVVALYTGYLPFKERLRAAPTCRMLLAGAIEATRLELRAKTSLTIPELLKYARYLGGPENSLDCSRVFAQCSDKMVEIVIPHTLHLGYYAKTLFLRNNANIMVYGKRP